MAEQVTQGDLVLAGGAELGPVACDWRIQFQLALTHQLQGGDCSKGLGTGEQVKDGVAVPGLLTLLVGNPGPQIHHGFTADLHAERHTALLWLIEQCRKGVSKRFELEVEITLYLHHPAPFLYSAKCSADCFSSDACGEPSTRLVILLSARRIALYGAAGTGAVTGLSSVLGTSRLALRTALTKPSQGRSVMATRPK